ncbi:MAG: helix-turn-helix domain-containing protein [Clostridiales bacterium]|nr:helix-turn-helix domain-containing protein [Clostridiales bacterium]
MTTIERIIEQLQERKIGKSTLANAIGVLPSAISDWQSGRLKPSYDDITKIADYFNVTTDYLLGRTDSPKPKTEDEIEAELMAKVEAIGLREINKYPVPVVGMVAAGKPILAVEDIEAYIYIDYPNPEEYFAVRVRGDSMTNVGIIDGSIAIIHRQNDAYNGDIILALLNDEATIKTYRNRNGMIFLQPENPDYDIIPITPKDDFIILGTFEEVRTTKRQLKKK